MFGFDLLTAVLKLLSTGGDRLIEMKMASLHGIPSSQSSYSMCHQHGQGRPPWLKGKEIGLYYRDRARARAKARVKAKSIIKLPKKIEHRIRNVLANSCHTNNTVKNKYRYIYDSQFKQNFLNVISGNIQENLAKALSNKSSLKRDKDLDAKLLEEYEAKQSSEEYNKMMKFRVQLPCHKKKAEIIELIKDNQVVVISGETGCGKSTQVCQYILDDQIQQQKGSTTCIICTQPRRISAISVAERVAAERAESLGKSVGFKIRLEKVMPRDQGSILFCTTGVLLQTLQTNPALNDFSHIILDEIHERSTESDFILALLKLIIPERPDLKVLLMSATLNSHAFSEYYNHCSMIHIPGFTYPVKEFYLEDVLLFTQFKFPIEPETARLRARGKKVSPDDMVRMAYAKTLREQKKYSDSIIHELTKEESESLCLDLVQALIVYICNTQDPGAILVFLPGMMDILNLQKGLTMLFSKHADKYIIHGLYSRMATDNQKLIFEKPPEGVRKIILATSIAEASITIEDVVYVIDSGKIKYCKFDSNTNIEILKSEWVSLANAKQRRGRAGRVKPGICYHLYTKGREETFEQYPLPEMLTTRLENIILQMKRLQLGKVEPFLLSLMDPPDKKAINCSLELLRSLNAIDNEECLTPLGYHLTNLSLEPRAGKMVIWAALFSCLEPVLAIAASVSFKDAFCNPLGKLELAKERKLDLNQEEFSDHIAMAEAIKQFEICYKKGRAHARAFCNDYFLSYSTLQLLSDMKTQIANKLYEMKFIETASPRDRNANKNSYNIALVKALLCVVLYPNIACWPTVNKKGVTAHIQDSTVAIHPGSVNANIANIPSSFIVYFFKRHSTATFLHDTTFVTKPILLFVTNNIHIEYSNGRRCFLRVGNFPAFECDLRSAHLILELQRQLNNMLQCKIRHPGTVLWDSHEGDLLKYNVSFERMMETRFKMLIQVTLAMGFELTQCSVLCGQYYED